MPPVAIVLFLAAVLALLWLTYRNDRDEQQQTLISDVLWMEQNLRFQLESNETQLFQLGPELLGGASVRKTAQARVRQLLAPDSALVRIMWVDGEGRIQDAQPPFPTSGSESRKLASPETLRLARAVGRATYSPTYQVTDDGHQFETYVPYFAGSHFAGAVIGVYSLETLLSRQIPWWFSERYQVVARDARENILATKSKAGAPSTDLHYAIPFEPPGHGLTLEIEAYRGEIRWIPIALACAIVLLAVAILASLWQLRRHVRQRQAAEAALRSEHAFRTAMEESLGTGLRARDLHGRITYVNRAFADMVGREPDELIGLEPPMPYWAPEEYEHIRAVHDGILAGKVPQQGAEVRLMRKNGERFDALIFEAPLIDATGQHTGWMGSVLDVTEQKRAQQIARQQQERLQASARLVTMGEMASTLAHELNQPLAAIASYNTACLNMLEQGQLSEAQLSEVLGKIGKQARRAGQIIRRVRDFVRRSEPRREPVDINAVVREAVGLVEADGQRRQVTIQLDLQPDLPLAQADPVMLEQVAVNLIRNGMDAMTDIPRDQRLLTIATRTVDNQLRLSIADRGCGIPDETAQKLFAPFFTTKQEGMGMGLNICRSIAEQHHGALSFEPNPGGGTIFTFSIPAGTQ